MAKETCGNCRHDKSAHHPNSSGTKLNPEICTGAVIDGNKNELCKCTRFIPKEDASQAAVRIVRDATEE